MTYTGFLDTIGSGSPVTVSVCPEWSPVDDYSSIQIRSLRAGGNLLIELADSTYRAEDKALIQEIGGGYYREFPDIEWGPEHSLLSG